MTLRHVLAPAWLGGLRLWRGFSGTPTGVRVIILHDTAPQSLPALEVLAERIKQAGALTSPGDFEAAREEPRLSYLFSFDDGFASNLHAARVLAGQGVSAVFFVCPGLMDLDATAQRDAMAWAFFGGRTPPDDCRLLSWAELDEIRSLGHAIGAHGMTHTRLTELTGDALEREIVGASERLREHLGDDVPWYAYSYGDVGSISAEAMQIIRSDYRYCRSGIRGINDADVLPHALRGEELRLDAPGAYQRLVLEGGLDARYRQNRLTLDVLAKTE